MSVSLLFLYLCTHIVAVQLYIFRTRSLFRNSHGKREFDDTSLYNVKVERPVHPNMILQASRDPTTKHTQDSQHRPMDYLDIASQASQDSSTREDYFDYDDKSKLQQFISQLRLQTLNIDDCRTLGGGEDEVRWIYIPESLLNACKRRRKIATESVTTVGKNGTGNN